MTLPNFFIVGAAKAGTTSLYHYLKQHPDIYMPSQIKETFFFSRITPEMFPGPGHKYAKSAVTNLDEYRELYEQVSNEKAIGEACVAYLYYFPTTINRILDTLGENLKIIISLRNPIDRAYSNYLHHIGEGWEPLSFLKAIEAENWRKEQGWWWGFQYLPVGYYYEQVKAYLDVFGRERVLIVLHEELVSNQLGILQTIFKFLEVDTSFAPDISVRHNVSKIPRNQVLNSFVTKPNLANKILRKLLSSQQYRQLMNNLNAMNLSNPLPLAPKIRQQLIPLYRENIGQLQDLIGRDLSHWLE